MAKRPKRPTKPTALEMPRADAEVFLTGLLVLGRQLEQALRDTPPGQIVRVDLDDLDDLAALLASDDEPGGFADSDDDLDDLNGLFNSFLGLKPDATPAAGRFGLVGLPGPAPGPKAKAKAKAEETFPVALTGPQRLAVLGACDLAPALKRKVEAGAAFTRAELDLLYDEVDAAASAAKGPVKTRLAAAIRKLEEAFADEFRAAKLALGLSTTVYQWKVTLLNTKPPIWRRLQVPDGTLGELHDVIQAAMGWSDSHMHAFEVGGVTYGAAGEFDVDMEDEDGVLLSHLLAGKAKLRMVYEYDFGDAWRHEVKFEKAFEPEPGVAYPRCTAGARACPPEDCGGVWGFADFLETMADPKSEHYRELKAWYGGKFDPEEFSADEVNKIFRGDS